MRAHQSASPTSLVSVSATTRPPITLEPAPAAVRLELRAVSKAYGVAGRRKPVLEGIDLRIGDGECVAIVGFSGSGKTTLISLMAGLIQPDQGTVLAGGKSVTGPGPDRGVVFQSYALMPWMTVRENVALAVDQVFRDRPRAWRRERVSTYVDLVGLTPAASKRPSELSGGMRQRVSLARALAADPEILLLDEPLGALDALTRANLQDEITRIWEHERKTVVLITNDVDEALIMADRIIPLDPPSGGQGARLGPEFAVDLPRPRDRSAMNHDVDYIRLRKAVTEHLISMGAGAGADTAKVIPLKSIEPRPPERGEGDSAQVDRASPAGASRCR